MNDGNFGFRARRSAAAPSKFRISVLAVLVLLATVPPKRCFANDVVYYDYRGTLGHREIGLTIGLVGFIMTCGLDTCPIWSAHYYNRDDLIEHQLQPELRKDEELVLRENDRSGRDLGHFDFSLKKVHNYLPVFFNGSWLGAAGSRPIPVSLKLQDFVSGGKDGGRCDLSGPDYQKLQAKIERFYDAAVSRDYQRLKRGFHYDRRRSRKRILAGSQGRSATARGRTGRARGGTADRLARRARAGTRPRGAGSN